MDKPKGSCQWKHTKCYTGPKDVYKVLYGFQGGRCHAQWEAGREHHGGGCSPDEFRLYSSGSQPWPHIRIIWGDFQTLDTQTVFPDQLNPHLWAWDLSMSILKALSGNSSEESSLRTTIADR